MGCGWPTRTIFALNVASNFRLYTLALDMLEREAAIAATIIPHVVSQPAPALPITVNNDTYHHITHDQPADLLEKAGGQEVLLLRRARRQVFSAQEGCGPQH